MAENSTAAPGGKRSPVYRVGETVVFKYEGNVRAQVEGHQIIGGKVWIEASAADMSFLVPAYKIVGAEPEEEE